MSGLRGPMWFDPAPPGYPWQVLMVPIDITSPQQAERLVDEIKEAGNESLRRGDNYDALWKYNHALVLCRNHNLPLPKVAVVSSNCAQACINLKYYMDAFSHADHAIRTDPLSNIVHKAFYRRAEAIKLLILSPETKAIFPFLPPEAISDAIRDYCQCYRLKENTKALCEAIVLAVNNSVPLPLAFIDCDVLSGSTSKVLQELLLRPDSRHAHLDFLLTRMVFQTTIAKHFDCASIQFRQVCKKSLGKRLLHKLFSFGMTVSPDDVAHAVELLPDTKIATLDVIAANCQGPPRESLSLAYQMAVKLNKPQLLECLVKRGGAPPETPQEKVSRAKEEGNEFYRDSKYNDALAKYYKALSLCKRHQLEKEEAVIRGNCAQVCLQLELFKDAYEHADECLHLDPDSAKGYYRRAEALRKMLESRDLRGRAPKGTSFSSVVKDYFQSHRKTESSNCKAIYQAIVVATNHDCTKSLPKLTEEEVASGLATKLLLELVQREDSQQKHLTTLLCTLVPETTKTGIDASSLQVTDLLQRKSITNTKLLQRLFKFGLRVTEMDVASAVQILQERQKNVLQLLLTECLKTRKSTFTSACQEAIKAKKFQFIVCLIDKGGLPDFDDLKDATGWPQRNVDPAIAHYLMENTRLGEREGAEESESSFQNPYVYPTDAPPKNRADLAAHVMQAKKLHEEGKAWYKEGKLKEAMKKYGEAITVCGTYRLMQEGSEIYYSCAVLHMALAEFQTAFDECTLSLRIHPTPKMYNLRADILRKALGSSFHTVPVTLNYGMVVFDYCNSHRLKDSVKALTEAIMIAVDQRVVGVLKQPKMEPLMNDSHIRSGFCTKLLLNLLKREDTKDSHVRLLVMELPIHSTELPFDGSKIDVSVLLKRKFTDKRVLKFLFECGMKAGQNDIKLAVETLTGDSTATLDVVCAHFNGDLLEALELVCPIAMKVKKIRFVLYLLKKGCKLPCTSQEVLTLALQKNTADTAESLLPFCALSEVDLGQLMSTNLANHPQLLSKMIDGGVNPNGLGKKKPLAEVQQLTYLGFPKRMDLICLLLIKGCDCNQLCVAAKHLTTPLHVATTIGLEAGGDTRVLDALVDSASFTLQHDGKIIDGKGQTPLHLAMNNQWKREHSYKLVKALIETHRIPIDPSVRDQHGKKATDLLTKNDKRAQYLAMAADRLQQKSTGKKAKKKNGKKQKEGEEALASNTSDQGGDKIKQTSENLRPEKGKKISEEIKSKSSLAVSVKQNSYEMMSTSEKIELHLKKVFEKKEDYFVVTRVKLNEIARDDKEVVLENSDESRDFQSSNMPESSMDDGGLLQPESVVAVRKSASPEPLLRDEGDGEMNTVMSQYGLTDFDGLPWEVEVTNNVLKFFKNEKKHPYQLRLRAARTVYELAEGKRGRELSKELSNQSPNLFEAKMTKGGRIIWQRAVQFSPLRTGDPSNPIYTQVIRIWEVVPDHDQLNQTIKNCVKQIEYSNERGLDATLNVSLVPQKQPKDKKDPVKHQEVLEIPKIFTQADVTLSDPNIQRFTPAASPKEDEFNVTTFYSFSGAVLKSMLTGCSTRRDFPFKEWPKEHEIINLPGDEAILLLGRSGTGKTTCCLYRLWNEFKNYWDPDNVASVAKLPRKPLVTLTVPEVKEEEETSEAGTGSDEEPSGDVVEDTNAGQSPAIPQSPVGGILEQQVEETEESEGEESEECSDEELSNDESESEEEALAAASSGSPEADTAAENMVEEIYEHLHQVFVTKNYVLCAQMKKRFYDMAASHDFLDEHMDWEQKDLPHSFTDIDDKAYPLFVTARQFYILLDNSIGSDECFFRPREKDGSLRVKILSSDYDHEDPDTLLDLEESESEGEDVPSATDYAVPSAAKQHTEKYVEVTSLYFSENIWPVISQKCGTKNLDPLLVWIEIQSFIKGSRVALEKGSVLDLENYLTIGNKMAPNFASERGKIYKLFQHYKEHCQNQRHRVFLFDECDLVHDIYRRLRSVRDLPWSVHTLYIDEVQDFTQAELALYLHCCRDPNSLFFTGDTAQSIMRGIAFRFQDLRSSFHVIHEKVPQVKVPQKPHTLTINFRSHSGILHLAGSVIDLLQTFFTGSIDHLPEDNGMFAGPSPVILESCDESDLALLLSSNRRESSRIEFGAHQVVLVQSKEAKENLPSILKGAIVLTIFESKGLEFDDVLLYNFFRDSMVDEKGWRVITAFLEENPDCVKVNKRLPGASADPRSNKFDERCHKALNSELKYLYTAITRAKCNLWIYDSELKKRLPMFDLWYKRDLVKVVGSEKEGLESQHSLIFASISTPQQWKTQGDYFMRRSRWEQAKHCYDRAGPENQFLSVEAHARLLVQTAMRQAKPQIYLEAAAHFLYSDELVHNVQCLTLSAQCLRRAKPPKYVSAAKLFERLGKNGEALKCYRKAKDTVNCVRLLEKEGRYNEAVKMYRIPKESLAKASEYTSKGIELSSDLMPDNLSYMYARRYANRKGDKTTLVEVLEYMPNAHRRARFLKEGGLYNKAFDVYVSHDELDDAYQLASSQCLFSLGKEVAQKHEDVKKQAEFVFHQVQAEYFIPNKDKKGKELHLSPEFRSDLHALVKAKDPAIKAHASLLLGIAENDAALCRTAHKTFLELHNKVAALEAFSELTKLGKNPKTTMRSVLDSCTTAKVVQNALMTLSDLNLLVKQATALYGLQKVRDVYLTPQNHNMWVSPQLESQCLVTYGEVKDLNGMLRLRSNATRDILAAHVGAFVKEWLEKYHVQQEIKQKLTSFKLHEDIQRKRFLLRLYTKEEVAPFYLKGYMEDIINYCDLGLLVNNLIVCDTATSMLLTIFSPQVAIYLPLSLQHVLAVRNAVSIHKSFHKRIKLDVEQEEQNRMDVWFSAWRACTLSDGNTDLLSKALGRLEEKVNGNFKHNPGSRHATPTSPTNPELSMAAGVWKGHRFEAPPAFKFWKYDGCYSHTFSSWLFSCSLIRDKKKPVPAAKQAIYHLLGTIAQRRELSISVMNLVDVLIIHCMSLFAILTHLNYLQKMMQEKFIVPFLYGNCVHLFDILNCYQGGNAWVYTACADEVRRALRWKRVARLRTDCFKLLDTALSILLGTYKKDFSLPVESQRKFKVLTFALRNEKVVSSGAARHCLVLALTLFFNLIPHQNQHTYEETGRTFAYIISQISQQEKVPPFLQEGIAIFQHFPVTRDVLKRKLLPYVGRLLNVDNPTGNASQAFMRFDEKKTIILTHLSAPKPVRYSPSHLPSSQPSMVPMQSYSQVTTRNNPPGRNPALHQPAPRGVNIPPQPPPPPGLDMPPPPAIPEASKAAPVSPQQELWEDLSQVKPDPKHYSLLTAATLLPGDYDQAAMALSATQPQAEEEQLYHVKVAPGVDDTEVTAGVGEPQQQVEVVEVVEGGALEGKTGVGEGGEGEERIGEGEKEGEGEGEEGMSEGMKEGVEGGEEGLGEEEGEDEEEEAPGISALHTAKRPLHEMVDPALLDPRIVTEQFCNICGVPLRVERVVEDNDEEEIEEEGGAQPKDNDLVEVYDSHVQSDGHARNFNLHNKFKEDFDGRYSVMVQDLTELIHTCELTQAPSLARVIDDMKEALEKYERKMSYRENNLQWRMGIKDIEKATDMFQQLLTQANRGYQKVMSERPVEPNKGPLAAAEGAEDSDTEFDAEINRREEEEFDDHRLVLRSEETKMHSRVRKKTKRGGKK